MKIKRELSPFLKEAELVSFDTETTGLHAISNYLVEIAAVKFRLEDRTVSTFQELIKPRVPMPEEVIRIHGITDQMVADARTAPDVLADFVAFCGPSPLMIAHNAPFDISFVAEEMRRAKMLFGPCRVIDTVDIFRRLFPDLPGYSLLMLARMFDVAETQEHRALADALLVKRLFEIAAPRLPRQMDCNSMSEHLTVYNIDSFLANGLTLPKRFEVLPEVIERGGRLEIEYTKPGQASHHRVVRPDGLQKISGVVYLTGFCELADANRTFRLDRIASFKVIDD